MSDSQAMSPFTEEEMEKVRTLHAANKSRNAISRETKIYPRRVSAIAAHLGLTFERGGARTAKATAARVADAKKRRARIMESALASAEKLLQQMWSPSIVYNFGGKDNDYNEQTHPEPPFSDKRAIASAIQSLSATALRMAEFDRADAATSGVDEYLEHMINGGGLEGFPE